MGDLIMDDNGVARRGLLVRHLVLPDNLAGTKECMEFLAQELSPDTYVNVMAQYRPCGRAFEQPSLKRHPTGLELAEAERLAREALAVADRTHYPLEVALPLAALTQMAVARGAFDEAEQHGHQALMVQRLTGYHWAAGLFLPALMSAHVARGRYDAARDVLDMWAETGGAMEQPTVALF